MRRALGLLAATALFASGAVAASSGSVGAQATTTPVVPLVQTSPLPVTDDPVQVYVVHGLNLDGQTAQTDGGTAVTVCADGDQVLTDFQFGDIAGPLVLPVGDEIPLTVTVGADVPCGTGTPAITQTVTVPVADVVSLVATAGPDGSPTLVPVEWVTAIPLACDDLAGNPEASGADGASSPQGDEPIDPDSSRLGAVHAANAGQVAVNVDGTTAGELSFGESLFADLPPDTYSVEVTLGGTPIVGPAPITLEECTITMVYVVGNQPIGETPTTPAPAPAAQAVAARPAFTG